MTGELPVHAAYRHLYEVIRVYELNVDGAEVRAIRDLYCVIDEDLGHHTPDRIPAPAADVRRWLAATRTIVQAMGSAREQERRAHRPFVMRRRHRILWQLRHLTSKRRLRADYEATVERLRGDVLAAYRAYREQAGDLTEYIAEHLARREREQRERDQRERDQRAEVMAGGPHRPIWAYGVRDHRSLRVLEIYLPAAEPYRRADTYARTGLTPQQVHSALTGERAHHPYTGLTWSYRTRLALEEWHDSGKAETAWREVIGEPVELFPQPPGSRPKSPRHYGPSSNYWSPGGHFGMPF
ncbi:hypothetical protein [Actinoallomurus acaciae]|uniref:Uncharacterized protein n=1 Tax=Actinoallomurus acaciae TaxID=502577 RepID=A0ABV5YK20_9ACTN